MNTRQKTTAYVIAVFFGFSVFFTSSVSATTTEYLLFDLPGLGSPVPSQAHGFTVLAGGSWVHFEFQNPAISEIDRMRLLYDDNGTGGDVSDDSFTITGKALVDDGNATLSNGIYDLSMFYDDVQSSGPGIPGDSVFATGANNGSGTMTLQGGATYELLGKGLSSFYLRPETQFASIADFRGDGWVRVLQDGIQISQGSDWHFLANVNGTTEVPEPTTLLLLGSGVLTGVGIRRRREQSKA